MSNPALTPDPIGPLSPLTPGLAPGVDAAHVRHRLAKTLDTVESGLYYGILAIGAGSPFLGALHALMR